MFSLLRRKILELTSFLINIEIYFQDFHNEIENNTNSGPTPYITKEAVENEDTTNETCVATAIEAISSVI